MKLDDVIAGMSSVTVSATYRDQAARNLTTWWDGARYAPFRPQIESLAHRQQWNLLVDSFYRMIPFGTGGDGFCAAFSTAACRTRQFSISEGPMR